MHERFSDPTPSASGMAQGRAALLKSENALHQSEERYRALFESIDEGFCIIEKVQGDANAPLDFRFIETNPAFALQSGFHDVIGKTVRQLIPDECAAWLITYETVRSTGQPIRFERELIGQGRVLELNAFRVEDNTQQRVGVSFRDITQRRLAEQQLRSNHDTFATLIEHAPFGLYVVDAQFRMRQVSAAAQQVFGHIHPLLGRDFAEIVQMVWPAPFANEVLAHFRYTLQTGAPYAAPDSTEQRADAPQVESYDWKIERVTLPDGEFGVVCYFYDITERKQLEAKLSQAMDAAQKANLAKSDFLSGMSHELRTPLNAILGFAQLIQSGTPAPTASQQTSLEQILKGGWYLLELINDILDVARIESGRVPLALAPVALAQVVSECRALMAAQSQARGIDLQFPRFDTPAFVQADRIRLKQVLINLLANAIKYNKPSGSVTVECTPSPPDCIRISVHDTGVGLTPEQCAQLFLPFNRLGQEASTVEGTGIGLALTKRLVEQMGGTMGVESTLGVGSLFWLELPQTRAGALADLETHAGDAKHAAGGQE